MDTNLASIDASRSALLTDLYQLTMLQAYEATNMRGAASFELFFRRLPQARSFVMVAGLEPALEWLEQVRFQPDELDWLAASGYFRPAFIEWLRDWQFTGSVDAVQDGTIVFPGEPVLRVTAPIGQAQFVESRLLNIVHAHSVMTSKAARCVLAAQGWSLVEFGLRRAHGAEAAMIASRASAIAGFEASANVLSGMRDGLPLAGTMAHSYVLAHEAETLAFINFGRANPDNVVLLIDTWNTEQGAYRAVAAAEELARDGISVKGVRIDSGDLDSLSRRVRAILDEAGLNKVRILASGDLEETRIAALKKSGAPIDVFCVGTALSTSFDAPSLDLTYKLVEYDGRPCGKRSLGKATLPGNKQVWRRHDNHGHIDRDLVTLSSESMPQDPARHWRALLQPVMRDGRRTRPAPEIAVLREHAAAELAALPAELRALDKSAATPVRISARLRHLSASTPPRSPSTIEAPTSALANRSAIARQASSEGGRSTRIRETPARSSSRSPA